MKWIETDFDGCVGEVLTEATFSDQKVFSDSESLPYLIMIDRIISTINIPAARPTRTITISIFGIKTAEAGIIRDPR